VGRHPALCPAAGSQVWRSDLTAGGVMHAVTSAAQIQDDADTAHEMESAALQALDLAATL
jgi:hypothetical protein